MLKMILKDENKIITLQRLLVDCITKILAKTDNENEIYMIVNNGTIIEKYTLYGL